MNTAGGVATNAANLGANAANLGTSAAGLSAAGTTATAGGALAAIKASPVGAWLVAGLVGGTAVSGVAVLGDPSPQHPATPALSAPSAPSTQHPPRPRALDTTPNPEIEAPNTEIEATARANARDAARVARAASAPPVRSPEPSPISAELALLQDAQRTLASGDARGALASLDAHARRFPNGALAAERSGARVFALCQLGKTGEAVEVARAFLRSAPTSPLVPRILASCAGPALDQSDR